MANHKHTLLAQASTYGVLGSPDGKCLIPAAIWAINALREHLRQPARYNAPPPAPDGGITYIVDAELPPEAVIEFTYRTEELTGITVYCAFYQGFWLVREIRGEGWFRVVEGGAEWRAAARAAEDAKQIEKLRREISQDDLLRDA